MFEKATAFLRARMLQQLEQAAKDTLAAKASGKGDKHSVEATPSGVMLEFEARTKVRYVGRMTKRGTRVMPSLSFRKAIRNIPKMALRRTSNRRAD